MSSGLRLATLEREGRRCLVAPLPSDPSRVVDLHHLEQLRLAKLGEGRAEVLAEALVPASLRTVLASGPRALNRLRQALAYAEKWELRSGLPEDLAFRPEGLRMLPCLPDPSIIRRADGSPVDRASLRGPGVTLAQLPHPTLAVVGVHGGRSAGFCLALEDPGGLVLGGWLSFAWPEGHLKLRGAGQVQSIPIDAWEGLSLPRLQPGEVRLLPAPRLRPIPGLGAGACLEIEAPFDCLQLSLGGDLAHPTLQ